MTKTVDLVAVLSPTMKESMLGCVMPFFRAVCLGVVGMLVFAAPAFVRQAAGQPPSVPAPRLNWSPCRDGSDFECARAQVPLDYRHPKRRTIELAVIKREATNPARRIGTLLWNPGGPGGAGTEILPLWYGFFPREVRERFDIVSWDPRGVGQSTAVRCFDSAEEALAWREHVPAGFPVGKRERAIWIRAYAELGWRCHQHDRELLRHVSTADTARDLDQLRQAVGDEQLTYLGTSYGTLLGATYANLFPDKVRAMVLDGGVDPQAYMNTGAARELLLNTGLRLGSDRSSAATLDQFLGHCGAATIERCAFSAGSPQATREKFDELMRRLRAHPQGVWTYGRTVDTVTTYLFSVHPNWTRLAEALQDLWDGRTPEQPEPPEGPAPYPGFEQEYGVVCSESINPRNPNWYHLMEELSSARAGDVGRWWTWDYEPCATWPAKAASRYTGPWNRPTANPILVVGNTYDPATPYEGAQALVRELADAHLLTLAGYGHTALRNPSTCIHEHESRYLIDATLPPEGTVCLQDQPPFGSGDGSAASGPLPARTEAEVREIVRRFRETNNTPGVLVGIWSPRGTFVSATGVADLATGEPLNADMQFKIASLTKTFVANLILQLVGEGKLSLDDHISKWIAGVPNGNQISIRQILNHTSGLGNGFDLPAIQSRLATGCTVDYLLATEASAPPVAAPGTKWSYSNYGYALLGRVVELATGQDLSAAIRQRIAMPLGLRRTLLPTSGNGLTVPFTHGYGTGEVAPTQAPTAADDATALPASCLWAHGGMVSTLDDLRVWSRALATGALLKPEVWRQAKQHAIPFDFEHNYNGPGRWKYGLGFVETGGFIGGEGSFLGYESTAMYSPALGTAIVVVSTKQPNAITPPPMFQALAMAVFGEHLGFGLTPAQALEPNFFGAGPPPE